MSEQEKDCEQFEKHWKDWEHDYHWKDYSAREMCEHTWQAARKQNEFYKKELGNLLAILHRDGGHYITENGWEKAVEDGKIIASDTVVK